MKVTETGRRRTPNRTVPQHKQEEFLQALPDLMFRMSRDGRYLDFKPAKDFEPYVPP